MSLGNKHKNSIFLLLLISCSIASCTFFSHLYHTSTEIFSILDNLETSQCASILTSHVAKDEETNNEMKYYTVTLPNNATKNKVLIVSGEHAREVVTPEITLYFIEQLCSYTNNDIKQKSVYSKNTLKTLLNQNEFLIIPIMNTDGRNKVKNGDFCLRGNNKNVDLTHNWDNNFKVYNNSQLKDEKIIEKSYPGDAPFSEWETRIVRNIILDFMPKIAVSIHSGDFSLILPTKSKADGEENKAAEFLETINRHYCRCSVLSLSDFKYKSYGNMIDYLYENLDIPYTYAFEIYQGFSDNKYFNELFKKNVITPFNVDMIDKRRSFLQKGLSSKTIVDEENEPIQDKFLGCIARKNPLIKSQLQKIKMNWTNALFELFTLIYKHGN